MPQQRNTFKLGLTVIAFFVLFFGVLVFIAGNVTGGGQTFVVRFPASQITARLKKGGEVVCGGQSVGSISSIEFREEPGTGAAPALYVYVTAGVDPVVGLRQDCKIVPGEPLLGEVSKLEIRDRGVGKPVSPDTPIDGRAMPGLNASIGLLGEQLDPKNRDSLISMIRGQLDAGNAASLVAKIHRSLDDLNEVTRNVSLQLNPGQRDVLISKLHAVLDNINTATGFLRDQVDAKRGEAALAKVHTALDSLNKALATTAAMLEENRGPIGETVGHVRNTARTLDEKIAAQIAQQLDVNNAASLIADLHGAMDRLQQSLDDVSKITGAGREVIVSNKDTLNKTVANLKQTSDYLKAGIQDLARNPWRLLYKPADKESRELKVFDAARSFADAAAQLDDATMRLKGIVDARGGELRSDDKELISIRDALQHSVEQFGQAEQALWKQLDVR
jgi:ABC-type transporter Mla subunit MlaD